MVLRGVVDIGGAAVKGERMKKLLLAIGALLVTVAAPALAEDPAGNALVPGPLLTQAPMPPPMPMGYNWTGLYLGVNGGWVESLDGRVFNTATDVASSGFGAFLAAGTIPTRVSLNESGGMAGGTLGYNWQVAPQWVAGGEIDADWVDESARRAVSNPIFTTTYSRSQDFMTTARARVGWLPIPQLMLFATAGIGVADNTFNTSFICPTCVPGAMNLRHSHNVFTAGPVGGGGLEWMVLPNWSIKAEYIYASLSSLDSSVTFLFPPPSFPASGTTLRSTLANTEQMVRVGINYHFAPPPPPPPAMPPAPMPPPQRISFIVFFDWDKDVITREGMGIIQKAADAYRAGGMVQIQVTGYTDRSGSAGYNQRLSERRANNVAKALAGLGVPPTQMAVSGRGENDNRVPTADGVREPQNRRVEIVWP
jgi:outer membrane protein OmpA-like peptidoglycan-associated protein